MADRYDKDEKIVLWVFENEKKNDKQPDMTGPGSISKEALKALIDAFKEYGDGEKLQLRAAAWNRESKKNGNPYLFFSIEPNRPKNTGDDADFPF